MSLEKELDKAIGALRKIQEEAKSSFEKEINTSEPGAVFTFALQASIPEVIEHTEALRKLVKKLDQRHATGIE